MTDRAEKEAIRTEVHPGRVDISEQAVAAKYGYVCGCAGDRPLTGDLFLSYEIPDQKRPAIVFLHGGGWYFGEPTQFHHHSLYLASRYDFVCLSVDYRLSWEARFPAPLEDAKCAVRWLRAHADTLNIDSEKIAIAGGSAGAHLASLMMTTAGLTKYEGSGGANDYPSHVNCAVLFNGEFDMWDLVHKESLIGTMKQFVGAGPDERPDIYDELSTIQRVSEQCPPALLLHGTEDDCVSHEQSVAFHEELVRCGVQAELELYEGKPHAWFNFEPDRTITLQRMEAFLVETFALQMAPPIEQLSAPLTAGDVA